MSTPFFCFLRTFRVRSFCAVFQTVDSVKAAEPNQAALITDQDHLLSVEGRIVRAPHPPQFLPLGVDARYNLTTGFSFFFDSESENSVKEKENLSATSL